MKLFSKLKRSLRFRYTMCVILDPNDNSVIFSRKLYEDILKSSNDNKKVIQFRERGSSLYSFSLYWGEEEFQLTEIQVAADGHVGFAAVCPTVNRIFFDYKINPFALAHPRVFSVTRHEIVYPEAGSVTEQRKRIYYTIEK